MRNAKRLANVERNLKAVPAGNGQHHSLRIYEITEGDPMPPDVPGEKQVVWVYPKSEATAEEVAYD